MTWAVSSHLPRRKSVWSVLRPLVGVSKVSTKPHVPSDEEKNGHALGNWATWWAQLGSSRIHVPSVCGMWRMAVVSFATTKPTPFRTSLSPWRDVRHHHYINKLPTLFFLHPLGTYRVLTHGQSQKGASVLLLWSLE